MKKILLSGASGFIGSYLVTALGKQYQFFFLTRKKEQISKNTFFWDPYKKIINLPDDIFFDTVIHLSGENIASRWTAEKKRTILESRVVSTQILLNRLKTLQKAPELLIVASATGYYSNQGNKELTENSPQGESFLARVVAEWEKSSQTTEINTRICYFRLGMVLSPQGGALKKILPIFRLGLGGILGKGEQYWSWIAIEDVANTVQFCMENKDIHSVINLVSPFPETNKNFTRLLASSLKKIAIFPVPSFVLKFILGEMANELLLSSQKVVPKKLLDNGYSFQFSKLSDYFAHHFGSQ